MLSRIFVEYDMCYLLGGGGGRGGRNKLILYYHTGKAFFAKDMNKHIIYCHVFLYDIKCVLC